MVFYSILKNLLYAFKGVLRYLCYALLLVIFIIICLLLLERGVFAYEGSAYTEADLTVLNSIRDELLANSNEDYDCFTYTLWYDGYPASYINLFYSGNYQLYYSAGKLRSTIQFTGLWARVEGNRVVASGTFNKGFNDYDVRDVGTKNGEYFFYSNLPLYDANLTDVLWQPPPSVNHAYIDNFVNSTLYEKTVSGECPGIYIVRGDASVVALYIYDTTYIDLYGITEDNGFYYAFYPDSVYYLESHNGYAYPIAYLPFVYQNGHNYQASLQYKIDGIWYDSEVYQWTTNFSSDAIDWEAEHLSAYLNNNNVDNNKIIDGLPNTSYDYAGNDIANQLYDTFQNLFLSSDYEDLVITLPDNETEVVVRANYIENHCPSYIKFLIQTFYWYLICRFIIVDILRSVDSIKQGDYISASEGNIKTEVL